MLVLVLHTILGLHIALDTHQSVSLDDRDLTGCEHVSSKLETFVDRLPSRNSPRIFLLHFLKELHVILPNAFATLAHLRIFHFCSCFDQ